MLTKKLQKVDQQKIQKNLKSKAYESSTYVNNVPRTQKNKKINIKSFHIIKVIRYEQNFLREIIFGLTIFSFSDKKQKKIISKIVK